MASLPRLDFFRRSFSARRRSSSACTSSTTALLHKRLWVGTDYINEQAGAVTADAARVALLKPPLDETANLLVLGAGQGASVTFSRVVAAAEPTENVGTSEVERRVVLQDSGDRNAFN